MTKNRRFTQLSSPQQVLVRLLQSVNFGYIEHLEVRDGEPVFNPAPAVVVEIKLDAVDEPRPETDFADFELRSEVAKLLEKIDQLGNGTIDRIDIRYGVPRRAMIERPIREVR